MHAQQSDMVTKAIKDLYKFCKESTDRQMTQIEFLVSKKIEEIKPLVTAAFTQKGREASRASEQHSRHESPGRKLVKKVRGRFLEPHGSSMSVTEESELCSPSSVREDRRFEFDEVQRRIFKMQQVLEYSQTESIEEIKQSLEKQLEQKYKKM